MNFIMKISIFSFGRKNSQRCQNKMLRPFASTTLTDIILAKLGQFKLDTFFAGYEDEFRNKCKENKVRFVNRDEKSINIDEPIHEILSFIKHEKSDYFLLVNACLPFLKIATIEKFLNNCINKKLTSSFAITRRDNYFLDNNKFWNWEDVTYFAINDKFELFDIDTEIDFNIAENMQLEINKGSN